MEKTNFTSYSSWTKAIRRMAALAVALCCLGVQFASAGHVYDTLGQDQPDTPYDADNRATYSVAQPNDVVLFNDGITTILTAQGMNCGSMTYPFFDAGGIGAPYSDEGVGVDQAFTVCPNSAMNQAVSVEFTSVVLTNGGMLAVYDGDDTNDGTATPITGPVTIAAGFSGTPDGTGCLTFELTGQDGVSDEEGWRAVLTMTEFANNVTVNGLDGNDNGVANEDADENNGAGTPGNPDGNLIVELEECSDDIPAQALNVDYDCGTAGNPFFVQNVTVDGTPTAFLYGAADGDDSDNLPAPATGTGVSADPSTITVPTTALVVGTNTVCVNVYFDSNVDGIVDAGDVLKSTSCFDIVVSSTEPLACNDDLNIGLDGDCRVTITPDVVLESPCEETPGVTSTDYEITLTLVRADDDFMDPQDLEMDGEPGYQGGNSSLGIVNNGTDAVDVQIPGRYRYSINLGGNTCWGFVNLEDKRGPVCAPALDLEIPVIYDRDCDGDITNADGTAELTIDPSGDDDLASEYVLCTVLESAEELAPDGLSIYFDELEAMDGFVDYNGDGDQDLGEPSFEGDFFDCTGIKTIYFQDEVEEICELDQLGGFPIDIDQYDETRFEVCAVYSRTWFAIDKKGFQSAVGCTQYIFGLRPKASEINLDQDAEADCGDDINDFCFQQGTAPYFFVEGGIVNNGQGSAGPTTVRDVCAGSTATVSTGSKRWILSANEHTCKYAVSFHEEDPIAICFDADGNPSARKIIRHWTVVDWCDGSRVYDEFTQLIKVEDNDAPVLISENGLVVVDLGAGPVEIVRNNPFETRPYQITLGTKLFDCEATGNLPAVSLFDNCSAREITRITIERDQVDSHDEAIFINNFLTDARGDGTVTGSVDNFDLTLGDYTITYFFEDDCGNADFIAVPAFFDDNRVPSAICNDELVVTLVPTGQEGSQLARVYGEDLDDTSRDNCHPVIMEVRKGDGSNQDWAEFVEFNCSDVTSIEDDATIKVELRVTEDRNGNGRIDDGDRDASGNLLRNICWTYIRIEDKTPPQIAAPNGDFLCDDPELNALQFTVGSYQAGGAGTDDLFPTIVGGCSPAGITIQLTEVDASGYDPICKVGTFFRTFRAVRTIHDNQISGNEVEQRIRVFFNSDWTMTFPADLLVVCDDQAASNLDNVPAPLAIEDILTNRGCDQWGLETKDEIFDIIGTDGDGACFKIIRTYKFINWCTWDPTNSEEGVVPRPLDFFDNPAFAVTLDYQSEPVLDICRLRNTIDDRFERSNDPYDLKIGNDGDNTSRDNITERDADFIYFDESFDFSNETPEQGNDEPDNGEVNSFFFGGDCIDGDNTGNDIANALFNSIIDISGNTPFNTLIDDQQRHNFVSAEAYGYFIYRQIIKVTDNQAPVIEPIDDFTVCDSINVNGNCTVNVTLPLPEVTECKLTYRVFYTVTDANGATLINNVEVAGNAIDGFVNPQINGLDYGTYTVRYVVEDGCGNNNFVEFDFSAMDCKAPTAYCVIGVNIELMPTGMVVVWAKDVDAGSFDDCSTFAPMVNGTNANGVQLSFSPNPADSSLTFTCDQRGSNFVQLWVTDAAGNQSFCETIINVQSNDTDECGIGAAIAGGTTTEMGEDVEGVEVRLSGASDLTLTTDVEGTFTFEGLNEGADYTITPEKDVNYLNGVSTFDLVLIRKHIIGTATLDSPYKLIAADVNNSQTVTTLDMVKLRQLILNIDTELENNSSWRFVDASYTFPTPSNPWVEAFPEVANFNDIALEMNEANFIAVKVGDVNNSAVPNMLLGSDERTSNEALAINVADATVAAGEEVTVDFTADMVDVAGYQFTLNFDNNVLDLVEIVEGAATAENFGTTLANEGTITTSFDGEVAADEVLFSLTFAAKASANLSELISVSSAVTAAEAYKGTEVLDVALSFGGATSVAGFELYQNTPNPFNGVTTISFNLPTAGAATLTVSDVTGKVLSVSNDSYAKGLNQVQFSSAKLGATGVLYYTLETADFTATKKMIIVE